MPLLLSLFGDEPWFVVTGSGVKLTRGGHVMINLDQLDWVWEVQKRIVSSLIRAFPETIYTRLITERERPSLNVSGTIQLAGAGGQVSRLNMEKGGSQP